MSEELLQTLHHKAVPGYRFAFLMVFGIMVLYLAIILISSPGSVAYPHKKPAAVSPTVPPSAETPAKHEAH